MKTHPLICSPSVVRAILDGRQTQDRRPVTPRTCETHEHWDRLNMAAAWADHGLPDSEGRYIYGYLHAPSVDEDGEERCSFRVYPRIEPGDLLWVRETFAAGVEGCEQQGGCFYRADHQDPLGDGPARPMRWTPSIHMPRWAARLILRARRVWVERCEAISEADARAEGFSGPADFVGYMRNAYGDGVDRQWLRCVEFEIVSRSGWAWVEVRCGQ